MKRVVVLVATVLILGLAGCTPVVQAFLEPIAEAAGQEVATQITPAVPGLVSSGLGWLSGLWGGTSAGGGP